MSRLRGTTKRRAVAVLGPHCTFLASLSEGARRLGRTVVRAADPAEAKRDLLGSLRHCYQVALEGGKGRQAAAIAERIALFSGGVDARPARGPAVAVQVITGDSAASLARLSSGGDPQVVTVHELPEDVPK